MLKLRNISTGIVVDSLKEPTFSNGTWDGGNIRIVDFRKTQYELVDVPDVNDLTVSPIRFKLLFTATQRIAARTSTDPIVQDFFNLLEDPRLDQVILPLSSTVNALSYLVSINILTEDEKNRILSNTLPP
jgi:hypothetical protein